MEKIFKVKRISDKAILPEYAHVGDAGMDFYSIEDVIIPPQKRALIHTGIQIAEIPKGHWLQLFGKSGLASKAGIIILGGVVDENYRGEVMVLMYNSDDKPYEVKVGQKIAQGIIVPVAYCNVVEVSEVGESNRGEGGFGSTGLNKK